ncbi:hypothetical protein CEUSTIGMA_g548.t1 [Chlamydomonas eustigma]|uniref:Nucleotide-diphospho-sugar transferase domain-containing protein n=1 Tax=Chlamydomonas eustigma TaxID=1157962 RepID=A0A250WQH1_9CHLO|nr:hypothetical protein CEUSTIGMA_g548.t1 [Chlamydomonas eustigma]|eukprot:GAX73095.1 hypothetical protein CEUSTIGMA_g548.t1 [Chlamydomonas eustigma]
MCWRPSSTWLLLLLLSISASTNQHPYIMPQPPPPTSLSEYASSGIIKPHTGQVNDLQGLRSALASCSFRGEVILITTSETYVDAAAQTIGMLRRFGIAHFLVLATTEAGCQGFMSLVLEDTCCVWYNISLPEVNHVAQHGFSNHRRLMHLRLRLAARILRLRYNILFLDTDIIIFDDPYKYFKAYPFNETNIFFDGSFLSPNIGIMYVQNVAPDGPVAWIFAESVDRTLRWGEDHEYIMKKSNPKITNFQHAMWDQPNFGDALLSAILGRPVFMNSWFFHEKWAAHHSHIINNNKTYRAMPSSKHIQDVSRSKEFSFDSIDLYHPFTGGVWPEELSGQPFPTQRGNFSEALQQDLRADGGPMWPDPEDPACNGIPQLFDMTLSTGRRLQQTLLSARESLVGDEAKNVHDPPSLVLHHDQKLEDKHVQPVLRQGKFSIQLDHDEGASGRWNRMHNIDGVLDASKQLETKGKHDERFVRRLHLLTSATQGQEYNDAQLWEAGSVGGGVQGHHATGHQGNIKSIWTLLSGYPLSSRTSTARGYSEGLRSKRLLLRSNSSQHERDMHGVVPAVGCPGRGKPERASQLPHWFSTSWSHSMHDARSSWNCSVVPPTQVLGHILFLPYDKKIYKNVLKMAYGWYNWTVSNATKAGHVYFSSTVTTPVPKVLAASDILVDHLSSMGAVQFIVSLRALFTAARISQRALAWPALPCTSLHRLILEMHGLKELKRNHEKFYHQSSAVHVTVVEKPGMCIWSDYFFAGCLDNGVGLLPPEFQHLLSTLPADMARQNLDNTVDISATSSVPSPSQARNLLTSELDFQLNGEVGGPSDEIKADIYSRDPVRFGDKIEDSRKRILQEGQSWNVSISKTSFEFRVASLFDLPVVYLDKIPDIATSPSDITDLSSMVRFPSDCYAVSLH